MKIAILNAHMFDQDRDEAEHVIWSEPDVYSEQEWADLLGMDVRQYAANSPHLIVWEVTS